MEILFPQDLQELIEEKVGSGEYDSPEHVVLEGLRLLFERDSEFREDTDRWRALIAEGLEQLNRGEFRDAKEVFRRLRRQLTEREGGEVVPSS